MNKQERLAKTIKNYHYLPDQQIGKGSNAKVYRGSDSLTQESTSPPRNPLLSRSSTRLPSRPKLSTCSCATKSKL